MSHAILSFPLSDQQAALHSKQLHLFISEERKFSYFQVDDPPFPPIILAYLSIACIILAYLSVACIFAPIYLPIYIIMPPPH